jgi:predicted nuclease of restriction endonuclease-like RecB superfamily
MSEGYKARMKGDSNPNYSDAGHRICIACGHEYTSYQSVRKYCDQDCYQRNNLKSFMARFTGQSRGKSGKREDLGGLYVRSRWEANYARYLNWLVSIKQIAKWEYEPDEFEFVPIKRGNRFYIPDFKVTNNNASIEYHEVKGWMDKDSAVKLKRMSKFYPQITVKVIDRIAYKSLANEVRRFIAGWES